MPKLEYNQTLEITVERFLNACSTAELFDVDRLIQQPRYRDKITQMLGGIQDEHADAVEVKPAELVDTGGAIPTHVYRCPVCKSAKRGPIGFYGACLHCQSEQHNFLYNKSKYFCKEEVEYLLPQLELYFSPKAVTTTATVDGVIGFNITVNDVSKVELWIAEFLRDNQVRLESNQSAGTITIIK